MSVIGIDLETTSCVNLTTDGADAYTRDPTTRVLCLAFKIIGSFDKPTLWRAGDSIPAALISHVARGDKFSGWNVLGFDRLVYSRILVPRHGFPPVPDDNWLDSMHLAASANLPRSLDGCAKALGVAYQSNLKDSARIKRITNLIRTPEMSAEDRAWLEERCIQDVEMEEAALLRLPPWPDTSPWLNMPAIDRRINDRGILIDIPLVRGMAAAAEKEKRRMDAEVARLSENAVLSTTAIGTLKDFLLSRGVELPRKDAAKKDLDEGDLALDEEERSDESPTERGSPWRLRKTDVADLLAREDTPEDCRQILKLRAEAGKASISKLKALLRRVGPDGRLRGALRLGGAQQTMRFSGQGVQVHNLVRDVFANLDEVAADNNLDGKKDKERVAALAKQSLDLAIRVGRKGDPDLMRALYKTEKKDAQGRPYTAGVMTWISRMSRRVLAAPAGKVLLNGDYSQVEARITCWLSQQVDVLSQFALGEDVYRYTGAKIYGLEPHMLTKSQRQAGKVSILASGFGGGPKALLAMAYNYGMILSLDEASAIVRGWRAANQATVRYWYATDEAAANAVLNPGVEYWVPPCGLVSYIVKDDCLYARLPSGRVLRYWQPRLHQDYWEDGAPKNRLSLTALHVKGGAVFRRYVFHTILCENQVQAIAVDLLADALEKMDKENMEIVLHVHDSIANEELEERAEMMLPVFEQIMADAPAWARGLPVAVDADYGARFG